MVIYKAVVLEMQRNVIESLWGGGGVLRLTCIAHWRNWFETSGALGCISSCVILQF